ncbi:MAG TPA: hypothetical protein VFK68_08675 [Propionibacteriaceae bacterium]|nr:hypothetical protein [Propionibacteriaceae bacterium]
MSAHDHTRYPLDALPDGATCRSVSAQPGSYEGRAALRVALPEHVRVHGRPGVDFIDQPTFVILPIQLGEGRIEVDICSELLPDAPDYARGFAGLAFAVVDDASTFEAVYVRPYNGRNVVEDPVRRSRAVQYFSYPDWPFNRLRDERDGEGFESGADIAPGRWLHLVVEFDERTVRAEVDGTEVLNRGRLSGGQGAVGLFVDIGTDAYFTDLVVTPAN